MTNVAIWQISQKRLLLILNQAVVFALINISPSSAHLGYPSALGRSPKAAQRMRPNAAPTSVAHSSYRRSHQVAERKCS